jgi:hypothetical protein
VRLALVPVVVLLASVAPAAAAPPPVSFGVELGVVSRDIEAEGGPVLGTVNGVADSTRITARLSLGLAPGLAVFGEVGGADLAVDEFNGYRSDMHVLYGGGLRFSLAETPYPQRLSVYSDFKVSHLATSDRLITQVCTSACGTSSEVIVDDLVDEDLAWTEYAVELGIKGGYQGFRPFGGVRFSTLAGTDQVRSVQSGLLDERADVRELDSVGFFFGVDILLEREERTAVTIQMSGIDENAFRVGYKAAF